MNSRDQIRAVVDDNVGLVSQNLASVIEIFVGRHASVAVDMYAIARESRADIVLSRERIASTCRDRRPELRERD